MKPADLPPRILCNAQSTGPLATQVRPEKRCLARISAYQTLGLVRFAAAEMRAWNPFSGLAGEVRDVEPSLSGAGPRPAAGSQPAWGASNRNTARLIAALAIFAAIGLAQQPRIQNGNVQTRSAAAGLDATIRGIVAAQSTPAWIAYSAPVIPGERHMCCYNDCCSGCRLESREGVTTETTTGAGNRQPIQLEAPKSFYVFYRVDQKSIVKLRTFTPDCDLDAGGVNIYWLSDVPPAQSVAFLTALVNANNAGNREQERIADGAVSAIAMHSDPAADRALDSFVATTQPDTIRRKAVFWLGNSRGRHGYEVLSRVVRDDPSDKVREHAIFSLTQNKDPDAIKTIVSVAHDDKSAHVRSQALFWLSQTAQKKLAADEISRAIDSDPETQVKKQAVFALSQLPEGVDKLIEVAKNNKNAVVRKQAMFWLGQSKDPRALKFFEDVLTQR